MIRLDCKQGSQEWIDARLGLPTSSQFHRVLSPKTRKTLAGSQTYRAELLAEWMIDASLDPAVSQFMERGTELEKQAIAWYEMQRDVEVERVGLCLTDDLRFACSPDGLVGEDGGLEIKCPSAAVHVSYLLEMPRDFNCQIQGAMMITGRSWWDFVSFNPEMPPALVRVDRDESFIADLAQALDNFWARLEDGKRILREKGYVEAETVLR